MQVLLVHRVHGTKIAGSVLEMEDDAKSGWVQYVAENAPVTVTTPPTQDDTPVVTNVSAPAPRATRRIAPKVTVGDVTGTVLDEMVPQEANSTGASE